MGGGKIIGMAVFFTLAVAGLAGAALAIMSFMDVGGSAGDDKRPVLRMAGDNLRPGSDGLNLLRVLGGADCSAKEEEVERWVFRVRPDEKPASAGGACEAAPGDLVVWVKDRKVAAFEPVHGESEVVKDEAGFQQYQRRYARAPVEEPGLLEQTVQVVGE
ncbi:MAG: hypothetical protein P1V51_13580 [Deltaproteobacteria bacterium]|nr:hypothetical protein [Deltaproteobacteria bacterium]